MRSALSIASLVQLFSERFKVGVDVDEVVTALRDRGIRDEIYYWYDVSMNTEVLRGTITRWTYPDTSGNEVSVVDITYGKMGNEFERLVCCKELLHILEPELTKVNTSAKLERLIEEIVLPFMPAETNESVQTLSDKVVTALALAILFPLSARNVLLEPYKKEVLSLQKIADVVELPPSYVQIVLHERWEEMHSNLLSLPI